tara:strand:- start:763 stop:1545 length:783 start_codon:yes stop_codon:yes gene_type:complete
MDYIRSEKNKGFLWNILYEKNIFNGIPNNNLDKVKELFESIIINVSENINSSEIIEINKEILKTLNTELQNLKYNLLESKNIKDDFKDEKKLIFDQNLENQKNSLNELINPSKPSEIDFSDKTDKPIGNNEMNKILEEMQKERNIKLNNIEFKISDEKIIKADNIMSESEYKNNEIPKLKIESFEELLESEVVNLNESSYKKIDNIKNDDIQLRNINKLLENEYKAEYKINAGIKLDNINKLINKILVNQEKIMNKLELI